MQKDLLAPFFIIVLVVAAGAFYGGTRYQLSKNTRPTIAAGERGARGAFGNGMGGGRGMGMGQGGGFTAGEVINKDENTLTLKLRDGGSKVIVYSTSTRVSKMQDGATSEVTTGTEIVVNGSANQDGSLTASTIQIRPAGDALAPMRAGQPRN